MNEFSVIFNAEHADICAKNAENSSNITFEVSFCVFREDFRVFCVEK